MYVYVHVPFCARRCAYCDFSIAVRRDVPWRDYVRGITRELEIRGIPREAPLETLYLGGGTPSRLGADGVRALIDALVAHCGLAPGAEVTLEANPEDVIPDAVTAWRDAGVNRVSLGVQSFDPAVLRWMRRVHDAPQAERAVHVLHDGGLLDVSLDLIYALPDEITRNWERDLDVAISLGPTHLSCYGLTIESQTPLGKWHLRGSVGPVPDERYAAEFQTAHDRLSECGFEHYEVSNYALPGRRARHNARYWDGGSWLGLGPAAHDFDGTSRRWNLREYAAWQRAVDQGRDPTEGAEVLSAQSRAVEEVYLGLRTRTGVEVRAADRPVIDRWVSEGWAELDGSWLRLTPAGWLRLDALTTVLTGHRSRC